jgi:hypothetical protein
MRENTLKPRPSPEPKPRRWRNDLQLVGGILALALGVGITRKGWLTNADVINCLPLKQAEKILTR